MRDLLQLRTIVWSHQSAEKLSDEELIAVADASTPPPRNDWGRGEAVPLLRELVQRFSGRVDLKTWLEEVVRPALLDDERILQAAAMLKVGRDLEDDPAEIVRKMIGSFIVDLIDPGLLETA